MSNLITIEQIGTSVPTDTIVLADQTRVKAENNMWEKPLAVQPALVNLEENIVGGATEGTDTFKKVEDKIAAINSNVEERYTKAEVDAGLNNKADKATTLAGYGITIIDCGSIV